MLRACEQFSSEHDEIVHDCVFDFYGRRFATCASDQRIKVWDQDPSDRQWRCSAEWKAHSGSVYRVQWAHPEFGQILASCSVDRNVIIWEEQDVAAAGAGPGRPTQWVNRASLVDSRDAVTDIKFSPRHMGLRLATCSADGFVRIYEAIDVLNLTHWPLLEEFESQRGACLAWNPSRYDPPTLLVGSDDPAPGSGQPKGLAQVWQFRQASRRWEVIAVLSGHTARVNDVAWAPDTGRNHHKLATASSDGTVRVWRLQLSPDGAAAAAECVTVLRDHNAEVWKVEWNALGTVLASAGDDGRVRTWRDGKLGGGGEWLCLSVLEGPSTQVDPRRPGALVRGRLPSPTS
eukprot:tig00000378_g24514.t1